MKLKSAVLICFVVGFGQLCPASGACETALGEGREASRSLLLVPFANPLRGYEANTLLWFSAAELGCAGIQKLGAERHLESSLAGRVVLLSLSGYLTNAASYYSHEIAHEFDVVRGTPHLWIDLSDWSHLVPRLVLNHWTDYYTDQEIMSIHDTGTAGLEVVRRQTRISAAGLIQNELDAQLVSRLSACDGRMMPQRAVSLIANHVYEFSYNLLNGHDQIDLWPQGRQVVIHDNDIVGYAGHMQELGIAFSRDDWLLSSALAFFASASTWNSVRAVARYLRGGDEGVPNISFKLPNGSSVSPPDFFLFPTIRGLFLQSELHVAGVFREDDGLRVDVGTGLDSFGANRTGYVDLIRVGGAYDALGISIASVRFDLVPFGYCDVTRALDYTGYCTGLTVNAPLGRRACLSARIESSEDDMLSQTILNKEEGMTILMVLGVGF